MNHSDSCPSCGLLWGYDGAADSVLTCDGITYGCPCGARFPLEAFHAPTCPDFCPFDPDEHLRVSASVAENEMVPAVLRTPRDPANATGGADMPETTDPTAAVHERGR